MTKAIRVRAVGGPEALRLEEMSMPEPGRGQVRVQVRVAGVNAPDLLQRSGRLPLPLPFTPGHEVVGAVEALGAGVDGIAIGTRVLALLAAGGGYAQHAVADVAQVTAVPADVSDEEALALAIQGRTALLLLRVSARLAAGDSVFVPAAAGGVGHLAIQLAKRLGCSRVIAGASTPDKRRVALDLGADAAIDVTRDGWPDEVRRAANERGVDAVLVMTSGATVEQSLRALAPLGRLVLFGAENLVSPVGFDANQTRALLRRGQSIGGFSLMDVPARTRQLALGELFDDVADKRLRVIAREQFALADAARAHAALESRQRVGKVLLRCD